MFETRIGSMLSASLALVLLSSACGAGAPGATKAPTATEALAQDTATVRPTSTPFPTATPNATTTKAAEMLSSRISLYVEKGYISKAQGTWHVLDDYSQTMAQIGYLSNPASTGYDEKVKDFVFTADFNWQSAVPYPETSGCGLYFRQQSNGDFYSTYLDAERVVVGGYSASSGSFVNRFGVTTGSGRVKFGNPAAANFTIIVEGYKANVIVDGVFVGSYTLYSGKLLDPGTLGYFTKSGSNKDYGTRCEATNSKLWVPTE